MNEASASMKASYLSVGDRFDMVISGYDRYGLPCGWHRNKEMEGSKPVSIRIGEPGAPNEIPHRKESYEAGAQCADEVTVEVTRVAPFSAFGKVIKIKECVFERHSDRYRRFNGEFQKYIDGSPRIVQLTGHSKSDARNAISHGEHPFRAGFMGVTTIVKHAKYSGSEHRKECEVWLDNWVRSKYSGRYVVYSHPVNQEDMRDITKEVWVAEYRPRKPQRPKGDIYGWLYDNFKGFPKGIDNALFFDGTDKMFMIYEGRVEDVSHKKLPAVVDDFYTGINPNRFRMVVTTSSYRDQIENAFMNSHYGLDVQRIPPNFCP